MIMIMSIYHWHLHQPRLALRKAQLFACHTQLDSRRWSLVWIWNNKFIKHLNYRCTLMYIATTEGGGQIDGRTARQNNIFAAKVSTRVSPTHTLCHYFVGIHDMTHFRLELHILQTRETSTLCWFDVEPASATLAQHQTSIVSMFGVYSIAHLERF